MGQHISAPKQPQGSPSALVADLGNKGDDTATGP